MEHSQSHMLEGARTAAAIGSLLGTATGDALGLPREGLPPERARRLFGPTVRHCLLPGRGMVSDDTDHAVMAAQSLLAHPQDPERFARDLARRLRWWLVALPAGAGLATLRAGLRLWVGVPPERSGVWSAGNGPMMRAPIIGAFCADDVDRTRAFIRSSTRLTHTDPRAERAALAVALAASWALRHGPAEPRPQAVVEKLKALLSEPDQELLALLDRAAEAKPLTGHWAAGPSGYAYDTLLAVLHTWLHHGADFTSALTTAIALGGDADTVGAVLGGVLGANLGPQAIPAHWLRGIWAWPRHVAWMRELGRRLDQPRTAQPLRSPGYCGPGIILRNTVFLAAVLTHGLRRALWTGSLRPSQA